MAELDTFPKLLIDNARRIAEHPAMREKDFGIWQTWSWSQVRDEVFALANGMAALGVQRGDKVAIVGDNRPRLYWSMAAVQCLGAIPVPTYQDSVAEEMAYVMEHAEVRVAVVEDQEQVDKMIDIGERYAGIEHVIFDEPRGLRDYDRSALHDFQQVQEMGRDYARQHPDFLQGEIDKGQGGDVAIFLYTSGTTGKPKGVVLSNDNMLLTARNSVQLEGLNEDDIVLAYLPMAWVGDHLFSYAQSLVAGFCVCCPESTETVQQNLREIGPTYYFAPPRVFEGLLTSVMIRMQDAAPFKQKLFHYFMDLAKRVGVHKLEGKPISAGDKLLYALGNLLIYGPLKDTLGMGRVRLAYTAGEAIGPEIFDFYRSLGINMKQIYGQTEAAVFVTIQPNGEVRADTVGRPAPGVEVEINDDGEVMYRSPGVFLSYYKNEEATNKTKTEDGWVYTGDAGYFDADGHLKIIDRAKDVGKFASGKLFAPKYIENKLKFFPHIVEAVAFGDGRDTCTAFINIDLGAVGNWAERNNIAYASYQELATHPQVYAMVKESIEQVNRGLAGDEMLAHSQVTRFLILHKELDADDGELTRTRKVRRPFISERYGELIDALYDAARDQCHIETEVSFEDGRKGKISGDLKIVDVETYAPLRAAG